jgi:hypothetical protein
MWILQLFHILILLTLCPRRGSRDNLSYSSETPTFYQNELAIRNTADVTGGKPIAIWSQSFSGVSDVIPFVTSMKETEWCYSSILSRTLLETHNTPEYSRREDSILEVLLLILKMSQTISRYVCLFGHKWRINVCKTSDTDQCVGERPLLVGSEQFLLQFCDRLTLYVEQFFGT